MGFDLYGKNAKGKNGEYFRNNVWWWRRLWQFIGLTCHDILTEDDINNGHYNNGHEYSEKKALAIAKRINECIKDGTAKEFNAMVKKEIQKAKLANATKKFGEPGYNFDEAYPFTISNLKEFARFCKDSGGFTIC